MTGSSGLPRSGTDAESARFSALWERFPGGDPRFAAGYFPPKRLIMAANDRPKATIELGAYSVQWSKAEPGRCVVCDLIAVGCGPAGFKHDDSSGPVCDACLTRAQPRLGLLLAFVNICRELAADWPADAGEQNRRSEILMAVARLYHAQESRDWPPRSLGILKFMEQHGGELATIPLEAWTSSMGPVQ